MQSLAHPAPRPNTRELRALELYRERGRDIQRIAEDIYRVPSQDGTRSYDVHYGQREECPCPDHLYRGVNCVHILAVGVYHAKHRRRVSIAGDPFAAAPRQLRYQDHPHACTDGYVYLGHTTIDEDGEEDEVFEALPCRRCADSR